MKLIVFYRCTDVFHDKIMYNKKRVPKILNIILLLFYSLFFQINRKNCNIISELVYSKEIREDYLPKCSMRKIV